MRVFLSQQTKADLSLLPITESSGTTWSKRKRILDVSFVYHKENFKRDCYSVYVYTSLELALET